MQISRRLTNGLAWAGLFIVVGVPSADILTAQFMGEPETIGSVVAGAPVVIDVGDKPRLDETRTASIAAPPAPRVAPAPAPTPVRAQLAEAADPVDQYLQSGRPLPSYISGGGGETATAPAAKPQPAASSTDVAATPSPAPERTQPNPSTVAPADVAVNAEPPVPQTETIDVATVAPDTKVAPVPMPLSMRPKSVTEPIVIPASVQATPSYPVVPSQPVPGFDDVVTAEELEDWESGPLSEFLAERGHGRTDREYDADGFFLDEGPDSRATYRRESVEPPVVLVYPLYN